MLRSGLGLSRCATGAAVGACLLAVQAMAQTPQASLFPAVITTYAGGTTTLGDGGQATAANLSNPRSLVFDPSGNLYIADSSHSRIRMVTPAGVISTIAGTGTSGQTGNGGAATSATINNPDALAIDSTGTLLYFCEGTGNDVRVINLTTHTISLFAGTGTAGYSGDTGAATAALLNMPSGIALDSSNNVYIADTNNNRIRKVTISTGIITTVVGTGTAGSAGDTGQAASAQINAPRIFSFDAAGNMYITDYGDSKIRKVTTAGVISTVAGTSAGFSGDGAAATAAKLNLPRAVNVDAAGELLIGDGANNRIRKVDASGKITTIAGGATTACSGTTDSYGDGCFATLALLSLPFQAITDSVGNLYIADFTNSLIRKITVGASSIAFGSQPINTTSATQSVQLTNTGAASLQLTELAISGTGFSLVSGTGNCTSTTLLASGARCNVVVQFAPTAAGAVTGAVTITDNANGTTGSTQTIALTATGLEPTPTVKLTVTPVSVNAGQSVTLSATVTYSGSTLVPSGGVNFMNSNAVVGQGTLSSGVATFIGVINPGTYSIVAAYQGDQNYLAAQSTATTLTVVPLTADSIQFSATPATAAPGSSTVMTVTVTQSSGSVVPTGSVAILDGTSTLTTLTLSAGHASYSTTLLTGKHPLTAQYQGDSNYAPLTSPVSTVYIGASQVATLVPGIVSTFAGTGKAGSSGNGGAATAALFNQPTHSVFDAAGNLYVVDTNNNQIRKISPAGVVSLVAGTGAVGYTGDGGPATAATLSGPRDAALDSAGNLYIAEAGDNIVRKVDTNGIITTFAGMSNPTPQASSGNNSLATAATLNAPRGLTTDAAGNVYIAEQNGNVIRKVNVSTEIISAFAGTGVAGGTGNGGQAAAATLNGPYSMAFDPLGNLIFCEYGGNDVRKIDTNGIITLFAGTGAYKYSGDGGLATAATFDALRGVAIDTAGDVYLADSSNYAVRRIDTSGIITTVLGTGVLGYTGDGGAATSATVNQVYGMSVDAAGNLYADDEASNVIRKVTGATGVLAFPAQIPATTSSTVSAELTNTGGLPLTLSGITLANSGSGTAFAVAPSGGTDCQATTVLAPGTSCLIGVQYTPAALGSNTGTITVTDDSGAEAGSTQVIQLTGTGQLLPAISLTVTPASVPVGTSETIAVSVTNTASPSAGTPTGTVAIMSGSTTLMTLTLNSGAASYVATLPRGSYSLTAVYSGDTHFNPVTSSAAALAVNGTNTMTLLSAASNTATQGTSDLLTANVTASIGTPTGTVTFSQPSGALATVTLNGGVATLPALFTFIGSQPITATYSGDPDYNPSASTPLTVTVSSGALASFTPAMITTLAGNGSAGTSVDGVQANTVSLNVPAASVGVDNAGNVYISDTNSQKIRKVAPNGTITTVAGTGVVGHTGDGGLATAATLSAPRGVTVDASGNLYILDAGNNCVRKVDTTGVITLYAGTEQTAAVTDTGDGGPATSATINTPRGIAMDASGNLFIAENTGAVIRKVSASGTISTVAGVGLAGFTGNGGPATQARLSSPNGVAVDSQGNLYIADTSNGQIRKVTASTGVISAYAGTTKPGYSGDGGLATSATFSGPRTVAVDAGGNVYVADTANNVVRKIDTDGYIYTIAGTGTLSYSGDGSSATNATTGNTYGVTVDSAGTLYIVDETNSTVRKIVQTSGYVDFGGVPFGDSASMTVMIGAAGSQALSVSGIALTGSGFSQAAGSTRGCSTPITINAGSECLLTATFAPAAEGNYSGTITVTDNAGNPRTIQLVGTGIRNPPAFALSSTPANFVTPGTAVSFSVKITSMYRPTIVPTGMVQFYDGSSPLGNPVTLDSTGTATLSVGTTLAAGTHSITVQYAGDSNFQAGTSSALLFGVQNDFSLSLSATSGTVSVGGTTTTTLTITPTGISPAAYTFGCSNAPSFVTCAFSPSTVSPSTSPVSTSVTITSLAPVVGTGRFGALAAVLAGLMFLVVRRVRRRMVWLTVLAGLAVLGSASGCGSGTTPGPSDIPVTISVTSAQATHSVVFHLMLR